MEDLGLRLQHWETYYRTGALATSPTSQDGGYNLEIREAWHDFFAILPNGARILDVGTGNGVVALIAKETASTLDRTWEIHGTDLAQIDPPRDVPGGELRFTGIEFHSGVATERLPFDEASFDAVSGHYALEYSDTAVALKEIFRVLKPAACAQFILHHVDSLLVRNAQLSLREAEFVLKETKLYTRLRQLLATEQMSPNAARQAGVQLRAAIGTLKQAMPQAREQGGGLILGVTLHAIHQLLVARNTMKPTAMEREIDLAERDLRASVSRLKDLLERARTDGDMASIEREAITAGFAHCDRSTQRHAGQNLVGWRLTLSRA